MKISSGSCFCLQCEIVQQKIRKTQKEIDSTKLMIIEIKAECYVLFILSRKREMGSKLQNLFWYMSRIVIL